jgi:hypothetical protein
MPISIEELRDRVREQTDTVNDGNITDEWLNIVINNAGSEVYDILVNTFQDYFVEQAYFTLTTSNAFDLTALDGGFYKEVGVDSMDNPLDPQVIHRLGSFGDRARYMTGNWPGSYRIHYTPNYTRLEGDADVLPTEMEKWVEMIDIAASRQVFAKREMRPEWLDRRWKELSDRLPKSAQNRSSEPSLIPLHDVYDGYSEYRTVRKYFILGTNLLIFG